MTEVERNFESAMEKEKKRNGEIRTFYKAELAKYNEAKQNRREAFEYCRNRQGDNSEAIK